MNVEQRDQLNLMTEALTRDFYHAIGEIALSGFLAEEKLLLGEAKKYPRRPMPEGTAWGTDWEYAWMFGKICIPDSVKGERIVMDLNPGGESTLFVNDQPFGTCRGGFILHGHHRIVDQTLTVEAQGSEEFELAMEVYGGTPLPVSPRGRCASGPIFPEEGVRMIGGEPAVLKKCTFGIWNEEAYQLWLDLTMLLDIFDTQEENSFLREKIGCLLGEMLDRVDIEVPFDKRRAAYEKAREIIRPAMEARNGTFVPGMGAIANSHLDVAWLWPIAETERKTIRTISQQLRLLEEYPEAKFLQSQCVLYDMCEKQYPELFEKVKEAISRGQWVAEGAMWVEPDTNLAGGEALIRQFLYGKRYFKEKLGVDSRIAWLPDSFGYSAVLPQILAGCEVDGLTTQKIFWTYNDAEAFPYHAFFWKGLDGSSVPCYLHMFYESFVDAKTLATRWKARLHKDGSGDFYLPFGYGDGGGGPTRDDFEQIRREEDLQGVPKMRYETPNELFERRSGEKLPTYRGELYFQCHRGTYTTQSAVKKGNRQSEQAMRAYELWASVAAWMGKSTYPAKEVEAVWKEVLLNQFHDILPGSAIARVYVEAVSLYQKILGAAKQGIQAAADSLCSGKEGVTLFHVQSCSRKQLIVLDESFAEGARTMEGEEIPCMKTSEGVLAWVKLPSMGTVSLYPWKTEKCAPVSAFVSGEEYVLCNENLCAVFNPRGELIRLTDVKSGKNRIGGVSNRMRLYRDLPRAYDGWDIDSQTGQREVEIEAEYQAEVVLEEGLRAELRFTMTFGQSRLEQTVTLDADARRLDFSTKVDWHECHKLLKVFFDTGIEAAEGANQIQFGHIMRPAYSSRTFDRDRFEVCNHGYTALFDATHGAAVLNDCKYGVSMEESRIGLSLLRAAVNPDPAADQGEHTFVYSYYIWDGAWEDSGIVQETTALNTQVYQALGVSAEKSYLTAEDPNVIVETVKLAEDGSGDMIVRVYESMNGTRSTNLKTAFDVQQAYECNMLEKPVKELKVENGAVAFQVHPFEIKTLRLKKQ